MSRNYVKNHKIVKEETFTEQGKRKKIIEYNEDNTYKNIKDFDEYGILKSDSNYEKHKMINSIVYNGDIIEKRNIKWLSWMAILKLFI